MVNFAIDDGSNPCKPDWFILLLSSLRSTRSPPSCGTPTDVRPGFRNALLASELGVRGLMCFCRGRFDLFGQIRRHRAVMRKFGRERPATLCDRAKVGCVALHLGGRHRCFDLSYADSRRIHTVDLRALAVEITHDVAGVVLRHRYAQHK